VFWLYQFSDKSLIRPSRDGRPGAGAKERRCGDEYSQNPEVWLEGGKDE